MDWFWNDAYDGKKKITACHVSIDIIYSDRLYTHPRLFEAPPLSQVKEGVLMCRCVPISQDKIRGGLRTPVLPAPPSP